MKKILTLVALLCFLSVAQADDNIRDHVWSALATTTGTGAPVNQNSPTLNALTTTGTLTVSGVASLSPSNASVTISPTGTGSVTINPATAGTINNMSVGATTPLTGAFTTVALATNYSGATWTTNSPVLTIPALTLADTTGNGTIAIKTAFGLPSPTFTASSAQTVTVLSTLFVQNPIASTNVTVGSAYSINAGTIYSTGYYGTGASLSSYSSSGGRLIISSTAPTITSGFGTSPTLGSNCISAGCDLIIGTSPGTTGVMGLPPTTNYWNCVAQDVTTPAEIVKMSAHSNSSVTFTFYNASGTATAPTASDDIAIQCLGH